jgi:DNA (cytosine-5)-methyltransferase 1
MVLNVYDNDPRPAFLQATEDISTDQVIRKREIVFSPRPYVPGVGLDTFRDVYRTEGCPKHWPALTKDEQRKDAFHNARLVCRNVHILRHDKNSKFREGEIHLTYRRECGSQAKDATQHGNSRSAAINVHDETSDSDLSNSHRRQGPVKRGRYTSADTFCCGGGASQGAAQAGFDVTWALDKDNVSLQTYALNHPGVVILMMDAHDFGSIEGQEIQDFNTGRKTSIKVDLLHLSPPCCYWSSAHTVEGPKDQANYESFTTIGPIIKKTAPRVFTMEQTSGLFDGKKFRRYFNLILNDMFEAGYNVRYKLQDCSKLGVPQPRKRLLFIGARRGIPLPHFPKDTHGPPGSGLKPFVYVADALKILERQRPHAPYDPYDDIAKKRRTKGDPYNPHTNFLKGCVTTGGGKNHHYSGTRTYTARELAELQTFTSTYKFLGSPTTAIKMIGNAVPPKVEEQLALSCAQTMEAFDEGLIDAEDDITDLRTFLESKGCIIRRTPPNLNSFLGDHSSSTHQDRYRYLSRLADDDPEPVAAPHQRKRRRTEDVEDENGINQHVALVQHMVRRESRPYRMAPGRQGLERHPNSEKHFIDLT